MRPRPMIALTLCALAGTSPEAFSFFKPPAPMVRTEDQYPKIDAAKWKQAYENANAPRILVLAWEGINDRPVLDLNTLREIVRAGRRGVSETPTSARLRVAFEREINPPEAPVELVSFDELRDAVERLGATLDQSREQDTTELLLRQLSADLLVKIRLLPPEVQGSEFSVAMEVADAARGRTTFSLPFDWRGGRDTRNVRINARRMAEVFVNDFAVRVGAPVRYTIQFFGIDRADALVKVREALRTRFQNVRTRPTRNAPDPFNPDRSASFAEFEVTVAPMADRDSIGVLSEAADAVRAALNADVETRETAQGTLALRLRARTDDPAASIGSQLDRCEGRLIARGGGVGQAARDELRSLYDAQARPRIAVFINRRPTLPELERSAFGGTSVENLVVVSTAGVGSATSIVDAGSGFPIMTDNPDQFIEPGFLERQSRAVEAAFRDRVGLGLLGLTAINTDTARARALANIGVTEQSRVMNQGELAELLRQENIADIAVLGFGTFRPDPKGIRAEFTFEAVRLSDSASLGSAVSVTGIIDRSDAGAGVARLADEAIGKLFCRVSEAWKRPRDIGVTVEGLESFDEWDRLRAVLRSADGFTLLSDGTYATSDRGGVVGVRISTSASGEALRAAFADVAARAGLRLDFSSAEPGSGTLRVVR